MAPGVARLFFGGKELAFYTHNGFFCGQRHGLSLATPRPVAESNRAQVQSFRASSPNLLLIGPGAVAEEFLVPLMPSLASPIVYLDAANPALPETPVGTLIVRDVARLTPPHQAQFLAWLNAQTETAVIAVSPRPLFPRVRRGAFSDPLYYRLNTVVVELDRG
jgi:hypothetical protein